MTTEFEKKHVSFPSIEQFKNAIRTATDRARYSGKDENGDPVYDMSKLPPTIEYVGTVKMHGTNAAVVLYPDGSTQYQSRERIITPDDDNVGFARFASQVDFHRLYANKVLDAVDGVDVNSLAVPVVIYGEWCGGNIQGKVALNKLDKMFVVFAIRVMGSDPHWLDSGFVRNFSSHAEKIYSAFDFRTYSITIDFLHPELSQNTLVDLTMEVETECPVGKAFDVSGTGEGIVWVPLDYEYFNEPKYWFKTKGEKHQNSKTRTIVPIDMEKVKSIQEAVDKYLTEPRLEQGLDKLREMGLEEDIKNTGAYLKWVVGDVWKEHQDEIELSGLSAKEVNPEMSKRAKTWFFSKVC